MLDLSQLLFNLFNQYRNTFAKNLSELGCTNVLAMAHVDALSQTAHSEMMPSDSVENVLAHRLEVCLTLTVEA